MLLTCKLVLFDNISVVPYFDLRHPDQLQEHHLDLQDL